MKKLIIILCLVFTSGIVSAQSHNMAAGSNCKFNKNSNPEGPDCSACKKDAEAARKKKEDDDKAKEMAAKAEYEKRKKESDEKARREFAENVERNKVREVTISMPKQETNKGTSSNNAGSNANSATNDVDKNGKTNVTNSSNSSSSSISISTTKTATSTQIIGSPTNKTTDSSFGTTSSTKTESNASSVSNSSEKNVTKPASSLNAYETQQFWKWREEEALARKKTAPVTNEQAAEALENITGGIADGIRRAKEEREEKERYEYLEKANISAANKDILKKYSLVAKLGNENAIMQVTSAYESEISMYKKERNKRVGKAITKPLLMVSFGLGGYIGGSRIADNHYFGNDDNTNMYAGAGVAVVGVAIGVVYFFKSIQAFAELGNYQADKLQYQSNKSNLEKVKGYKKQKISFTPTYNIMNNSYGFRLAKGF